MSEVHFEIADDVVVRSTSMPQFGENICSIDVVMTKEIFQECYKRWIEPQESEDTDANSN